MRGRPIKSHTERPSLGYNIWFAESALIINFSQTAGSSIGGHQIRYFENLTIF